MDEAESVIAEHPFWVGDWYVDPQSSRILREGAETRLEPKVMSLLVFLAQHPGEVLSRETLEDKIWPNVVVSYDALSGTIIKLRKALGDNSRDPQYLETISKKGYRLLAAVSREHPANTTDQLHAVSPSSRKAGTGAGQPVPLKAGFYLAIGFLGISLLALYLYISNDTEPLPQADHSDKPSLVVLPFVNLNDDPQQEYFSDGITDDLINDLSSYSSLHVIARRSAYIYKRQHTDIQTIARELGVDYILDGSIRRRNNQLRINVQLIDAATGTNIWAQRFDENTRDIFTVQDHIRKNILSKLSITLTKEENDRTRRQYTDSYQAYDLFLQGQAKLVTRASAKDSQAAKSFMTQAIALDPDFSRAHAALALIYADEYRFDWTDNPEQTRQLALKSGKRAIELDDRSPQAHWILGYIYLFCFKQHDKAIALGQQAIKLAPNDNDGYNLLAVAYVFAGEPAKARLIIEEIMQRTPRYSSMVPGVLGHADFVLQDYPAALAAYNESLEINPSRINSNVYKILVLYRMGEIDDAEFQVDELYNLHPKFSLKVWAARQPFKDNKFKQGLVDDLIRVGVKAD